MHESWRWTLPVSENCLFCCSSHDELYVSHYKIWCGFCSANILWTSEMTMWSSKKFNNFVTIKSNTMLLTNFMWLWMSNNCVKFHVKIPSGYWENGKKLGDTFFAAHCSRPFLHWSICSQSQLSSHPSFLTQTGTCGKILRITTMPHRFLHYKYIVNSCAEWEGYKVKIFV